jgi:hypothetical protein
MLIQEPPHFAPSFLGRPRILRRQKKRLDTRIFVMFIFEYDLYYFVFVSFLFSFSCVIHND